MFRAANNRHKTSVFALAFIFAVASVLAPWAGLVQDAFALAPPTPVATRAMTGGNSIAFLWKPAPGSTPTQYKVYKNGSLLATLAPSTANASGDQQRYLDTAVTNGTSYNYQVTALNALAEESAKTAALNVTHAATTVPTITLDPSIPAAYTAFATSASNHIKAWYPKFVRAMGSVSGTPTAMTIDSGNTPGAAAWTSGTTITFDETWASANLTYAPALNVFLHESTHVAQSAVLAHYWVAETFANYAEDYWFGNRDFTPNFATADWQDGYSETAYFMNWIVTTYNKPDLMKDWNISLDTGYDNAFFRSQTGLTIGEMWEKMSGRRMSSPTLFKNQGAGNKCLDLVNGDPTDFNNFQLQNCAVMPGAQQFAWIPDSTTSNQGMLKIAHKCVDVYSSGTANGTPVLIYGCNSSAAQKWIMMSGGGLKNPNSGKCLRPIANGTAIGTHMEIWTCDGSNSQNWFHRPPGMMKNFSGLGCGSSSGASWPNPVKILSCNDGQSSQSWQYLQSTPGATNGAIVNRDTGECMEPLNGSTSSGATMTMVTCDGSMSQEWRWQSDNTVKNMNSLLCLTLPSWGTPWELTQSSCASPTNLKKFDRFYQY